MRIRLALAASAVATLALVAASCSPLGDLEQTPAAQDHVVRGERTTARSSTVWKFAPSLLGTEWERVPTTEKLVALTFDAGSGDKGLAPIVATLEQKNVAATFFLTGKWTESFPGEAKEIAARFAIGNHTYSHPEDLLTLSDDAVVSEVERGADSIRRVTNVDPRPLFRFPYGARDARTIGIVNRLGYGAVRWTVDTLGWKGIEGGQSVDSVQGRILAGLQPGEIVLMHVGAANDGTTLDADALPAVIDALRAHGFGFTSLYRFAARYANVADDGSGRFSASASWSAATSSVERFGPTSRSARPSATGSPALFRLRAPQTTKYRLDAWWPVSSSYNRRATIVVTTLTGSRSFVVDQRTNGGRWTHLGTVSLRAGDEWSVGVARTSSAAGRIVADAFRLTSLTPP